VNSLLVDYLPRIYRFALRLCNDPHIAEDLAQETVLRAWSQKGRLRDAQALRVWLFRITANLWYDQLRRCRSPVASASSLEDSVIGQTPPPDQLAAMREALDLALRAMAALPDRQREALYLSTCEGLSTAEVGEVLGISAAAAKASVSLARKKVRELLPDLIPDPASTSDKCP
jgi:RNA polymerase sigma-70 factor, ECF subfamily